MNILVDIGHPADVHYFKNLIRRLKEKNAAVVVLARDKEVTFELLHEYDIPFIKKGTGGIGFFDRVGYTMNSLGLINREIRRVKPDLCISHASPYLAFAAARNNIPHVMFNDTEKASFFKQVVTRFKPDVYSPDSFLRDDIPGLRLLPSTMELAYLHPDLFEPDRSVIEYTGETYILLRFVANKATHDIGKNHMDVTYKRQLVQTLSEYAMVWISSEGPLPEDLDKYRLNLPPGKIHHVIAHAQLLAGDSATMSAEAAVLGVPSVFINDNCWGYIKELHEKYGLIHYYRNNERERKKAFDKSITILESGNRDHYAAAREQLLSDKQNMTKIMEEIVEKTVSVHSRGGQSSSFP